MDISLNRLRTLRPCRPARALGALAILTALVAPWIMVVPAFAATGSLSIAPLTWDTVGLDSNSPASGPYVFPSGARVCNTGTATLTGVATSYAWTTANPYIGLQGASTHTLADLAPGACDDDYYSVTITQNASAYDTTRGYTISASATGAATVSTPTPRQLYVEHLVSQNRNAVTSITGPGVVTEGGTYSFTLHAFTATNGYEELETFLTFPGTIFRVQSVAVTYAVGGTNDRPWADACGWDSDPTSATYASCIGPVAFNNGNVGGDPIAMTYTVSIVGTGSATLTGMVMDHSGSSFHYNSDESSEILAVTAIPAPPQAPAVDLAPSPLAFPAQASGTTSEPRTVTVTNTGTAPLVFGPGAATLAGADAGDFTLTADTCSSTSVAPGASCTLTYTFAPAATGSRSATLSLADNAADAPQTVTLEGTGAAPAVDLAPSPLAFPAQASGTTSEPRTVTVTNTGTAPLVFGPGAATLAGADAGDFTLTADTCSSSSIAPGASCTLTYTFAPAATGSRSATLSLADNAADAPQTVTLEGTGEAPIPPPPPTPVPTQLPAPPVATPKTSTGTGTTPQSVAVPVPAGTALTLLAIGAPVTLVPVPGQGVYTVDTAAGTLAFTPALGFTGVATPVGYRLTDAYGQSATSTYTPTVLPPAPPSPTPKTSSGDPGIPQPTVLPVPTGGTITLLVNGIPTSTVTVPGQGTYSIDPLGTITFTPVTSFTGTAMTVDYQVTDAYGQQARSTLTASVLGLTFERLPGALRPGAPTAGMLPVTGADIVSNFALALCLLTAGALLLAGEKAMRARRGSRSPGK
ncbi:MAG TPA: choice-of-anchor D domain-containing protein [Actinomycetota bacterium]|nr:choice-of-anchor D domain-containing protein [Actinomycetota bacterium]